MQKADNESAKPQTRLHPWNVCDGRIDASCDRISKVCPACVGLDEAIKREDRCPHSVRQNSPEQGPVELCYRSGETSGDSRTQAIPVNALHESIRKDECRVQALRYSMTDGLPQSRHLNKAVDAVGDVGRPCSGFVLNVGPRDCVQAVAQLLADQLADSVPIAIFDSLQNLVKERVVCVKVVIRGDGSRTAAAVFIQHVQFIELRQCTVRCAACRLCRLGILAHRFGCALARPYGLASQERHKLGDVVKGGCRCVGYGRESRKDCLKQRCGCGGCCALQVAERGSQRGRGERGRTHPFGGLPQSRGD